VNDIYEMMSTLRAVRKLRTDPIPDHVLERVLQAACWAPTGGNVQPWRVIVVRSPERKQALADIYLPEWYAYVDGLMQRIAAMPEDQQPMWHRTKIAGDYLADHIQEAPVILMFVADPRNMAITDAKLDRISMVGGGSVYTAVQNAMLAARTEGLGCTLTTLHCLREPEVKEVLGIPEKWATLAMVPLGYPIGKGHGPITRQPPSELAFDDVFGAPWE
jgi:nitroreductase